MATVQLPEDFKEFLRLLNSAGARYLVVGGYAVGYYGYPRATADLDIWISSDADNASKIAAALEKFGFDPAQLPSGTLQARGAIVRMGVPPFRLEILTAISGVEFEECYGKRVQSELDGIQVDLISLKHLKINKKESGRHKDLSDLEHLP